MNNNSKADINQEDNSMKIVFDSLKHIVGVCIKENPNYTEKECREWLYNLSPGFKRDPIFGYVYGSIYGIVKCEYELAKEADTKK